MAQIEKEEWLGYVKKVGSGEFPVPLGMISDYDDWRCRSIVGRMLYRLGDIEGAMTVLSTVVQVKPDVDDVPEYGLSEVEHKVLCLRDVAQIVWDLTGTAYAPLVYLDEAYHYCRSWQHIFHSACRGEIWYRRLLILKNSGDNDKALAQAQEMLATESAEKEVNPYRYYAYKFLAEDAAVAEDYAKACDLFVQGFKHYPLNDAGRKALDDAAAIEGYRQRYDAYQRCGNTQYLPWEKQPPVILRR